MRQVDVIFNSMVGKGEAYPALCAVQSFNSGAANYNPEVMAWLNSTAWYSGNDEYMTFEEAAAVTSAQFSETNNAQKKAIVIFEEAQYFTSVTYLANNAFLNCTLLEKITLPSSLTSIGQYAFQGCTSLALTSLPSGITSIGNSAFYNCRSLALTSMPSGITSIGDSAFYNCRSLALTSLPSSITSIGAQAFNSCTSLALTSLPSGITSIGLRVFQSCRSLALTSLPSGLTTIGQQAFQDCYALKDTLYEIPASVTEIADGAFKNVKFPRLKFLGLTPPTFGTQSIYASPAVVDCQVPSASLTEYQQAMTVLTDASLITISTY